MTARADVLDPAGQHRPAFPPPSLDVRPADREAWIAAFRAVRTETERRAAPLSPEDQQVQSMEDASPTKWHRAHTTWFFEQFLLCAHRPGYAVHDARLHYLFNSYYVQAGPRQPRFLRGLVTRPTVAETGAYRTHVDRAVEALLREAAPAALEAILPVLEIGLYHEQQHQELMLTDILHAFSQNPLAPAYDPDWSWPAARGGAGRVALPAGIREIGHAGAGFSFDNESPRHAVLVGPSGIDRALVTNGQWQAFMADGGYARAELWLSDGWLRAESEGWEAPGYWRREGRDWSSLTLAGLRRVDPDAPVTHVSYYEADAYARWAGRDLPGEAEWEVAAAEGGLSDAFGHVWQWTRSAYGPYPGYRPVAGALGEYNGKFMSNQVVLRGSSVATPEGHARVGYRNFFYPHQRWQFTGLRLADARLFLADVWAGLAARPKALPAKYFYDAAGSALFEAITELPEYYPTRAEAEILRARAAQIVSASGADTLVELGSGTSEKTRVLLDALRDSLAAYVPVDVSGAFLRDEAAALARDFPGLAVRPVVADFTRAFALPEGLGAGARAGFFPGSTIGNFEPGEAARLLDTFGTILGANARLVVGVDLVKDAGVLQRAYDDAAGVTAAFNLNLLTRINRELAGTFQPDAFAHRAVFDAQASRIEMHLVSREAHDVAVAGRRFAFAEGETIHTESSYKYTVEGFRTLAVGAGWTPAGLWTDPDGLFSVHVLKRADPA